MCEMPVKLVKSKNYCLVENSQDAQVPLHNDEAFRHGINFKAKVGARLLIFS